MVFSFNFRWEELIEKTEVLPYLQFLLLLTIWYWKNQIGSYTSSIMK